MKIGPTKPSSRSYLLYVWIMKGMIWHVSGSKMMVCLGKWTESNSTKPSAATNRRTKKKVVLLVQTQIKKNSRHDLSLLSFPQKLQVTLNVCLNTPKSRLQKVLCKLRSRSCPTQLDDGHQCKEHLRPEHSKQLDNQSGAETESNRWKCPAIAFLIEIGQWFPRNAESRCFEVQINHLGVRPNPDPLLKKIWCTHSQTETPGLTLSPEEMASVASLPASGSEEGASLPRRLRLPPPFKRKFPGILYKTTAAIFPVNLFSFEATWKLYTLRHKTWRETIKAPQSVRWWLGIILTVNTALETVESPSAESWKTPKRHSVDSETGT